VVQHDHDVRVRQRRGDLRLLREAAALLRVVGNLRPEELDHGRPLQLDLRHQVRGAEPARGEAPLEPEPRRARGWQLHRLAGRRTARAALILAGHCAKSIAPGETSGRSPATPVEWRRLTRPGCTSALLPECAIGLPALVVIAALARGAPLSRACGAALPITLVAAACVAARLALIAWRGPYPGVEAWPGADAPCSRAWRAPSPNRQRSSPNDVLHFRTA
jgi:hypothetical protein